MKIFAKLLLATLLPALLVVGLASGLTYLDLQQGFEAYVGSVESRRLDTAVEQLASIYERDGSFEAVRRDPERWSAILRVEGDAKTSPPPPRRDGHDREDRRPHETRSPRARAELRSIDPLELPHRVTLYDRDDHPLVGDDRFEEAMVRKPIVVDGVRVGTLGVRRIAGLEDHLGLDYLASRRVALATIAALALGLATVVALLFSRNLSERIERLTDGARRLAAGDHATRLEVRSKDELGELGRDFNALAATLETAEGERRRWVADTSHELRTPLTVLRGELEALQDGIRPLDRGALVSLHAEVAQLQRLVDDLGSLAEGDRGDLRDVRVPIDLGELVARVVELRRAQLASEGLRVELQLPQGADAPIDGDPARLTQLLGNLLENSRRYTDAPGLLRVRVESEHAHVRLVVEDGPPTVAEEDLPRLFERFFRPDEARSRARGGSGLGLSICAGIAQSHGAEIRAEPSPLGGLAVHLRFPRRSPAKLIL